MRIAASFQGPSGEPAALAQIPFPLPGEHLAGYLRRLVSANGLGTPRILQAATGIRRMVSTSADELWQPIRKATGFADERLEPLRWRGMGSHPDRFLLVEGQRLRSTFVETERLRACPSCLVESGTTYNRFHLHHVTACLRHGTRLLDHCPGCTRPLRSADPCHVWTCRHCQLPLETTTPQPAGPSELSIGIALMLHDEPVDRGTRLPSELLALDLNSRIAVIERLGSLVLLAREDEPVTGSPTTARPVVVQGDWNLERIRTKVRGAHDLLTDWPRSYEGLLGSLLDRNPRSSDGTALQRRFATKAGMLALRPLVAEGDRPIAFVDESTRTFLRSRLGYEKSFRMVRDARRPFRNIEHLAEPATLPVQNYATVVEAAQAVNGTGVTIAPWIEAGVLRLHRHPNGGMSVPRGDVEAAVSRMSAFPDDDGRDGLEDRMRFILPNLSPYAMRDLIVDLRSGEVPAFVRRRDLPGLRSLAFCDASLRLKRSEAIVGRWLIKDDYKTACQINAHAARIWGLAHSTNLYRPHGLARDPAIRRRASTFSCRDVVGMIQAETGWAMFHTFCGDVPKTGARWSDAVLAKSDLEPCSK